MAVSDFLKEISGALNPLEAVKDAATSIIRSVKGDPEKQAEAELKVRELEAKIDEVKGNVLLALMEKFYNFFLQYEGAAKDMPRSIQIVRGLIRPVLTVYVTGVFSWEFYYLFTHVSTLKLDQLDILMRAIQITMYPTLLVLGFWFGDKFLERTGALDAIKEILVARKGGKGQ